MNPVEAKAFITHTCRAASRAGLRLSLQETPAGYIFHWQHSTPVATTAHTKAIALWLACLALVETPAGFTAQFTAA